MKLFLFLLLTCNTLLLAIDTGNLSFYLLKNGKPLANQELIVFKKDNVATMNRSGTYNKHSEFKTDEDGNLFSVLPVGYYQIQVFAKEDGLPQVYVKKNFNIVKSKESQIIVSLKSDNSVAFIDEEAPTVTLVTDATLTKKIQKENGFLQIELTSSEDKKPIANARLFVKGLSVDIKTDAKGVALIEVPEGEQTLSIIHKDFSAQTIKLHVKPKETSMKLVEMSPASLELEEFVVLAPHVEGSIASLTAEKKNSSAIAEVLGSEQMSKKGDSNAAAALKRVAGITLVDGKNIYVRGLGERYSNVELNSLPLPSPNPTKRVVPLDIFPSSVIGSLKVQKSFSADIPGNFAGGYIDIRTKEDVAEDYVKVTLGVNAHSSALDGSEGNYGYVGKNDWTGFDDGTRSIPDSVLKNGEVKVGEKPPSFNPYFTNADGEKVFSKEQLIDMTKDLAVRRNDTYKRKVPVGFKGGIEFSKKFEIADKHSVGVLANYSYTQNHKTITENYFSYEINGDGSIDEAFQNSGENERTISNYRHGGMFNLNYNFDDIFKIKYTKTYLQNTKSQVRLTDGTIGSNNDLQQLYAIDWEERNLNIDQVSGSFKHYIWSDMKLDFGAENAKASLYQPDNIRYEYIDYTGTGDRYELKTVSTQNMIHHNMTSDDEVNSLYLKENANVNVFSEKDIIEFGVSVTSKTRESRSNKFFMNAKNQSIPQEDLYEKPDYILNNHVIDYSGEYSDMGLLVNTLFSPSDYYDATLDQNAYYIKTVMNPTDSFEFGVGLRKVDLTQVLSEYKTDVSTGLVIIEDNPLYVNRVLPNVDMRYKFDKDNQLRFSYSQSFIYPDFREFSSSGYFHPDEAATVIGNPDLTQTDITSYDVRFEHYYSATESMSGALFYKNLDNPIEDIQLPTTSLPIYSYTNTDVADLIGIELDAYKNFDFIADEYEYFYISGNFSYTYSNVSLTQEQQERFTSNNRALQGLSPLVLNAALGYDNTDGRSINLSYNYMSKRLRKLGLKNGIQENPDQYEVPPHVLDFTWQERLYDGVDFKFKARNLMDSEVKWYLGEDESRLTKSYKLGRSYEVSLSYKY